MEGTKYIYILISRSTHFYIFHFRNLSDGPCYRGQSTQLTELLNIHTFKALGFHFTFLQPDPKANSEKRLKWTPSVGYVATTKWKMCCHGNLNLQKRFPFMWITANWIFLNLDAYYKAKTDRILWGTAGCLWRETERHPQFPHWTGAEALVSKWG